MYAETDVFFTMNLREVLEAVHGVLETFQEDSEKSDDARGLLHYRWLRLAIQRWLENDDKENLIRMSMRKGG